jgi:tetratricopeptide (TPR) repeat protein
MRARSTFRVVSICPTNLMTTNSKPPLRPDLLTDTILFGVSFQQSSSSLLKETAFAPLESHVKQHYSYFVFQSAAAVMPCYSLRRFNRVRSIQSTPPETVMKEEAPKKQSNMLKRLFRRPLDRKSQRTIETTRCLTIHAGILLSHDDNDEPVNIAASHCVGLWNKPDGVLSHDEESPLRITLSPAAVPSHVPYEIVFESQPDSHDDTASQEAYWEHLEALEAESSAIIESPAESSYGLALDYLEVNELYKSLEEVKRGLDILLLQSQPLAGEDADLHCKLLHVQAEVLVKMERFQEGLESYQRVLDCIKELPEEGYTLTDRANLLCTLGRVAARSKDYDQSVDYFQQALHLVAHSNPSLSASIYRELAHVFNNGLSLSDKAVHCLQKALAAESTVYHIVMHHANQCCASNARCQRHSSQLQGILEQVRNTKKAIGRIHYEQGDLEKAIRFTMMSSPLV